jgi:hypothetical protein
MLLASTHRDTQRSAFDRQRITLLPLHGLLDTASSATDYVPKPPHRATDSLLGGEGALRDGSLISLPSPFTDLS